jgi:hypothetical protein
MSCALLNPFLESDPTMLSTTFDTIESLETLPIQIDYVCETRRDDWPCDQWRVSISSKAGYWSTDYFTGLGHRKKVKFGPDIARKPKIADVLHSLIMDANAADQNFHDWCADYGYSDDSIKALNTYKACLEIGVALHKHFSPKTVRQIRELLQDY